MSPLVAEPARAMLFVEWGLIMNRRLLISFLILMAPCPAAHAKETLVIAQSGSLVGNHVIYLQPQSAIKVFDQQSKISLIAKKPDWQLILANDRTKSWCIVTKGLKSPFSNTTLWMLTGQDFNSLQWNASGTATIASQPATDFKTLLLDLDTGIATAKRPAHVYAMQAQVVPKPVASAVCKFLSMPVVGSLPLKVIYTNGIGEPVKVLDTDSIQRKQIADAQFAVPDGYRRKDRQDEVFKDPNRQQAIEDMVQSIGRHK